MPLSYGYLMGMLRLSFGKGSITTRLQIKQIKQNEYFFSSTITKNYQKFFETKNAAVRSI